MLPTQFQVNWPFSQGEEVKNRFQDGDGGGHLGIPIRTIIAFFVLHSCLILSQLAFRFRKRNEK